MTAINETIVINMIQCQMHAWYLITWILVI